MDPVACTCNGGYYSSGYSCSACNANSWCFSGVPYSCSQYTYSLPLATRQNDCLCNTGFFSNGSLSPCAPCFACSYCPGGNTNSSMACPANAVSQPGASAVEQCYCPSGYYGANGTSCTLCPPKDYCSCGLLSMCPLNSFALEGSSLPTACSCNAGFYSTVAGGNCTVCPMNSYCPASSTASTQSVTNEVTASVQTTSSDY